MNINIDFGDLPTIWLQQELSVINRILAKQSYYSPSKRIQGIYSEFLHYPLLPAEGSFYMDDVLARLSEIINKFENIKLINDLIFGDPEMQRTSMFFYVNNDDIRLYKTALIKEIQQREGYNGKKTKNGDILVNGKLQYNLDNRELQYDTNPPIGLSVTSDYGRLLILLMSNLEKRVSYTKICDTINIDYKTEQADPDTDPSIKRQIQQIKKDLSERLIKAGTPKEIVADLIVARDGYKMNKIS